MTQKQQTSTAAHEGLAAKIDVITQFYQQSLKYPSVRAFAEQAAISPALGSPDPYAMFANLRAKVKYMPDPVGVEYIKAPWEAVRQIQQQGWFAGDCDDFSCLAYALLNSIGVRAKLAVGWYGNNSNPSHIWVKIPTKGGGFIDFDLCGSRLGQTKPNPTQVYIYG